MKLIMERLDLLLQESLGDTFVVTGSGLDADGDDLAWQGYWVKNGKRTGMGELYYPQGRRSPDDEVEKLLKKHNYKFGVEVTVKGPPLYMDKIVNKKVKLDVRPIDRIRA